MQYTNANITLYICSLPLNYKDWSSSKLFLFSSMALQIEWTSVITLLLWFLHMCNALSPNASGSLLLSRVFFCLQPLTPYRFGTDTSRYLHVNDQNDQKNPKKIITAIWRIVRRARAGLRARPLTRWPVYLHDNSWNEWHINKPRATLINSPLTR